jgi:hypothetical protein
MRANAISEEAPMNEKHPLQLVEYQAQRILTTAQVAQAYDATEKQISNNFNRNKEKYQEGTHYLALVGEEKRAFLQGYPQIEDSPFNSKPLYLWTEQGAFLHAKSLNTSRAWQAYALLIADYYRLKRLVETPPAPVEPRPMNDLFYLRDVSNLDDDFWCIFVELHLYAKYYPALISQGVPDISVAFYWMKHLHAHPDRFDQDLIGKYDHRYPDQRGTKYLPKYLASHQLAEQQALAGPASQNQQKRIR